MRTVVTQPTNTREQQIVETITSRILEDRSYRLLEDGQRRLLDYNTTDWIKKTQPTTTRDLLS